MSQNDRNKHTCKNSQLKDQLESATRSGSLKVRKFKRKTKRFKTIGEALTSGS